MGNLYGYIRVSTREQNEDRQIWMLGLARKMENEVEEHWYPCFYQRLRMEMAKYYEAKKYLRMVEKSTDYEEDLYDEAV